MVQEIVNYLTSKGLCLTLWNNLLMKNVVLFFFILVSFQFITKVLK